MRGLSTVFLSLGRRPACSAGSLSCDDLRDLAGGAVGIIVDDHYVELAGRRDLPLGDRQPTGDALVCLGPAAPETPGQFGQRRRGDEDRDRIREQ